MRNQTLFMLVEVAVFAGLGLVLDNLSISMPQGGSASFVMLPIILMAARWGLKGGLTTGFLIGILQLALAPKIYHWAQGLIDYGVAFTVVGLAAVFTVPLAKKANATRKQIILWVSLASLFGGILRYAAHTVAGAIFFAEYAGDQNAWIYSAVYNATYMVPAIIMTAVAASLLFSTAPNLLKSNK